MTMSIKNMTVDEKFPQHHKYMDYNFDFDNADIIHKTNNRCNRRIQETVYISQTLKTPTNLKLAPTKCIIFILTFYGKNR